MAPFFLCHQSTNCAENNAEPFSNFHARDVVFRLDKTFLAQRTVNTRMTQHL